MSKLCVCILIAIFCRFLPSFPYSLSPIGSACLLARSEFQVLVQTPQPLPVHGRYPRTRPLSLPPSLPGRVGVLRWSAKAAPETSLD